MPHRARWGLLLVMGCGLSEGGAPAPPDLSSRPARVVATTGMIADAAHRVAGEHATVVALMGPGVDPHLFKPGVRDLEALRAADLILYNGLHLEGKMADLFDRLSRRQRTAAVTRGLDPASDLRPAPDGFESSHDPHVWFDVRLWIKAVDVIRDELCDLDPAHADVYRSNADTYQSELRSLHDEVLATISTLPAERRVLITAHDAFFYFGHAYGFEVHGLQGISTVAEPSSRDVQHLARLIGTRRVPAIFGESSVPERNLQAVRAAVKADFGFDVRLIQGDEGQLYSDALGDPAGPAGTYIGMVRHNVATIVRGLGG